MFAHIQRARRLSCSLPPGILLSIYLSSVSLFCSQRILFHFHSVSRSLCTKDELTTHLGRWWYLLCVVHYDPRCLDDHVSGPYVLFGDEFPVIDDQQETIVWCFQTGPPCQQILKSRLVNLLSTKGMGCPSLK